MNETNIRSNIDSEVCDQSPEKIIEEVEEAKSLEENTKSTVEPPRKRKSPVARKKLPPPEEVLRAAARVKGYDFNTEAGCREYMNELVNTLGSAILQGEIRSEDRKLQEMLLTLGVLSIMA